MIMLFEGLSGSGKTTIIKHLSDVTQEYKSWHPDFPIFYNNGLCNKTFEDAVIADFLNKVKIKSNLVFDRSIISGKIYHDYYFTKNYQWDATYDENYIPFYFDKLSSGINSPLVIIYLKVNKQLAMKRCKSVFLDIEIYFEKFFDDYEGFFKSKNILLFKLQNDNLEEQESNLNLIKQLLMSGKIKI